MKRIFAHPIAVFLIGCALTAVFYIDIIVSPNSFLFNQGDDGIKNYYTSLYHAFHSEDPFLLTGMNYPYYEHAVFTDAAPLLSQLVAITGNAENGVGVFNIILLLSIPLTILFVFLVFRKYHVNFWWSLIAAISISMLAPQFDRLQGHYGLSFAFIIPCFWWMIASYEQNPRWIWIVLASLLTTTSFFVHPYNGLILSATGLAYFGLKAISVHSKRSTAILSVIATGIIPVIFFQVFMYLTDPVNDRVANGKGFFEFYGRIESFIHPRWPHSVFEYFESIGIERQPWEGAVYLGFGSILFLLFALGHKLLHSRHEVKSAIWSRNTLIALLVTGIPAVLIAFPGVIALIGTLEFILIFLLVRAVVAHVSNDQNSSLRTFAISAGLVMLWGMCIPLKYESLRPFADVLGSLSEFRSLGRFLWVPYFALAMGSVILLARISQRNKVLASMVFLIGMGVSMLEWGHRHSTLSKYIGSSPNLFHVEEHSKNYQDLVFFLKGKDPDAMVFLPFYYRWGPANEAWAPIQAMRQSLLLSYQTETPMLNINATHLSPSQSKKVLNFFAPPFLPKDVVSDIPPNDEVVIVVMRSEELSVEQSDILVKDDIIFENEGFAVYECDLSKRQDLKKQLEIVQKAPEYGSGKTLYDQVADSTWFYYQGFNNETSAHPFQGIGSLEVLKEEWNTIDEISVVGLDSGVYEISYYYKFGRDRPDTKAWLGVTHSNGAYELVAERFVAESYYSVGDWRRVAHRLVYSPDMISVKVLLNGPASDDPLSVDELMMRRVDDQPIMGKLNTGEGHGSYVYNNHWFRNSQ